MKPESLSERPHRRSDANGPETTISILQVLRRQRWVVIFFALLGVSGGVLYATQAAVWYESTAIVLVASKDPGIDPTIRPKVVSEDLLANHMQIVCSRRIVRRALVENNMMDLPSIQPAVSEVSCKDAADCVIERLEVSKGGGGAAQNAHTLQLSFVHTDPEESQKILESVLVEHRRFVDGERNSAMRRAVGLLGDARDEAESLRRSAEHARLIALKAAPPLYGWGGSTEVYQDEYWRVIEAELADAHAEESSLRGRLKRVQEVLAELEAGGPLVDRYAKLALIDSSSLERLKLLVSVQGSTGNTDDAQVRRPVAEAQIQNAHTRELKSGNKLLLSVFSPRESETHEAQGQAGPLEISFSESRPAPAHGVISDIRTPESLLMCCVEFLGRDLASVCQRQRELVALAQNAETRAKKLAEFELQDSALRNATDRQEALLNDAAQRLRQVETARALSGYTYYRLETPRPGMRIWPSLPQCAFSGLMFGLFSGLLLAMGKEVRGATSAQRVGLHPQ